MLKGHSPRVRKRCLFRWWLLTQRARDVLRDTQNAGKQHAGTDERAGWWYITFERDGARRAAVESVVWDISHSMRQLYGGYVVQIAISSREGRVAGGGPVDGGACSGCAERRGG